jgi:hypothetical protein
MCVPEYLANSGERYCATQRAALGLLALAFCWACLQLSSASATNKMITSKKARLSICIKITLELCCEELRVILAEQLAGWKAQCFFVICHLKTMNQ